MNNIETSGQNIPSLPNLHKNDHELIERARKGFVDNHHSEEYGVVGIVLENAEYFSEKLDGKILFNIGSPGTTHSREYLGLENLPPDELKKLEDEEEDRATVSRLFGSTYIKGRHLPKGASEVIQVDPFSPGRDSMKNGEKIEIGFKLTFIKEDALSFLNNQEAGSGNVLMSHVDSFILKDKEYIKRVAEGIYRVVPPDGVFMCYISNVIEYEAEKLFPVKRKIQGTQMYVFEKSNDMS